MSDGWDILDEDELLNRPPWVRVVAETIRLEDGQTVVHDFYRVDIPDFAIMFALTADGRVPLVEQYRHGVRRRVLELPAGGIFGDEAPLAAAQRELLEEAGIEFLAVDPAGRPDHRPQPGLRACPCVPRPRRRARCRA